MTYELVAITSHRGFFNITLRLFHSWIAQKILGVPPSEEVEYFGCSTLWYERSSLSKARPEMVSILRTMESGYNFLASNSADPVWNVSSQGDLTRVS